MERKIIGNCRIPVTRVLMSYRIRRYDRVKLWITAATLVECDIIGSTKKLNSGALTNASKGAA
jgi:hypothetical protein